MGHIGYSKEYLRQVAAMSIRQDLRLYQAGVQYGERVLNVPNDELFEDSLSVLIAAAMELALIRNVSMGALIAAVVAQAHVLYKEGDK